MKVRVKKKEKKRDRIVSGLSIIGFYSNRSFTLRIMVLKTCCTQVVYFLASTYVVCVRTQWHLKIDNLTVGSLPV